jgi:hypothetical protein
VSSFFLIRRGTFFGDVAGTGVSESSLDIFQKGRTVKNVCNL